MNLQESGEMYLETILILSKEKPSLRSIDIVEHLGYSKPSVSRAVNLLKNGGFILIDENSFISLTETGREIAQKIIITILPWKHHILLYLSFHNRLELFWLLCLRIHQS